MTAEYDRQQDDLLERYSRMLPEAGHGPHCLLSYGLAIADADWLIRNVLANADDRCRLVMPEAQLDEARVALRPHGSEKARFYTGLDEAIADEPTLTIAVVQCLPNGIGQRLGAVWPLLRSGGLLVVNNFRCTKRWKHLETCYHVDAFLQGAGPYAWKREWTDTQAGIRKV